MSGATAAWVGGYLARGLYSEARVPISLSAVRQAIDPETVAFTNNRTMLRVRDLEESTKFYTSVLGMKLLKRYDFADAKKSIAFFGYCDSVPASGPEKTAHLLKQLGTMQLVHEWGTEKDEQFSGYANGNSEQVGFGHFGLTVPNVYTASTRFESMGVKFRKMPDAGGMKGLAFILDPDGYSIEILASNNMADGAPTQAPDKPQEEDPTLYRMTQTMVRVRAPTTSLDFYTRVLGMQLFNDFHFPQWKFSLYFVGYCDPKDIPSDRKERIKWCFEQPAAIELTHNWGTEMNPDHCYANGNDEDKKGYGHMGLVVPDLNQACGRLKGLGVQFRQEIADGLTGRNALIQDPDGYVLELLENTGMDSIEGYLR